MKSFTDDISVRAKIKKKLASFIRTCYLLLVSNSQKSIAGPTKVKLNIPELTFANVAQSGRI